jgi:hypothetical protein
MMQAVFLLALPFATFAVVYLIFKALTATNHTDQSHD